MSPHCPVRPQVAAPQTVSGGEVVFGTRGVVDGGVFGVGVFPGLHMLASASSPPRGTHAPVVSDPVRAGTPEGAGGGGTLVYVDAAVWPRESLCTLAYPPVHPVDTPAAVVAGVWGAVVDVELALGTVPPLRTQAGVPVVSSVDAGGPVLARGRVAGPSFSCREDRRKGRDV